MELTLEKKHENRIEFWAGGLSTSMANAIRRYAMSRIPVFAMDAVTFYDNTSSVWDEYIAHRLGLMPITTPEKVPKSAEILFSLDETGPKIVYAKDMKSNDGEVQIAKGDIVVATLGTGQHLRFESKARLGTGREHAKYQAGLLSYGVEGGKFKFMVESFHQMPPARVVLGALDEMDGDLEELEAVLTGKPRKVKEEPEAKPKKKAAKKKAKEGGEGKEEKAEKEAKPKKEPKARKKKEEKEEKKEEKKE